MFKKLSTPISLLFKKQKEPYLQLRRILGFMPHNISIYRTALLHKSANYKQRGGRYANNERLEFLGDAVLSLIVAEVLYKRYPGKQEGFLTTLRSKLVRRDMLNELAVKIGLDKLVLHSENVNAAHNSYLNGNAFEAFVGAIYIDRGYEYCQRFMCDVVLAKHVDIEQVANTEENYKSKLIEWCQKYQLECKFEMVSQRVLSDRNTDKFTSKVLVEGVYAGSGEGFSKKESHQNAAEQAYRHIQRNPNFARQLREARKRRTQEAAEEPKAPGMPRNAKPKPEQKPASQQPQPAEKEARPAAPKKQEARPADAAATEQMAAESKSRSRRQRRPKPQTDTDATPIATPEAASASVQATSANATTAPVSAPAAPAKESIAPAAAPVEPAAAPAAPAPAPASPAPSTAAPASKLAAPAPTPAAPAPTSSASTTETGNKPTTESEA